MEYMPLGNLKEQNIARTISVEEMMVFMSQCLSALAFLHGQNITHRDLKPENVLVSSRPPFITKLGDFGLAQSQVTQTLWIYGPWL